MNHLDIKRCCGTTEYQYGYAYARQGCVSLLEHEQGSNDLYDVYDDNAVVHHISAETKGREFQAYIQNIQIVEAVNHVNINGNCNCYMKYNCKHIAAACIEFLKYLSARKKETNNLGTDCSMWLKKLAQADSSSADSLPAAAGNNTLFLVYVLTQNKSSFLGEPQFALTVRSTRLRASGVGFIKGQAISISSIYQQYQYGSTIALQGQDRDIACLIKANSDNLYTSNIEPRGVAGALLLKMVMDSGRCYWDWPTSQPLTWGLKSSLKIQWQANEKGLLSLQLGLAKSLHILPTMPVLMLNQDTNSLHELDDEYWNGEQLAVLQKSPELTRTQAEALTHQLLNQYAELNLPLPVDDPVTTISVAPRAFLRVSKQQLKNTVKLAFNYDGHHVSEDNKKLEYMQQQTDGWLKIQRDAPAEEKFRQRLTALGLKPYINGHRTLDNPASGDEVLMLMQWANFIEETLPQLTADGWQIEYDDDCTLSIHDGEFLGFIDGAIDSDDDIEVDGNDWFDLRFDLKIDDKTLPLAPLLAPALAIGIDNLPETLLLPLPNGSFARLPSTSLKPFMQTLMALFNHSPPDDDGRMTLSRFDAATLADLENDGLAIAGGKKLRQLASRLRNFEGIAAVELPAGFLATLRPYQQAGLDWLQFLREYQLNGILADDMGLGKTVQTLAHLQLEKNTGRLNQPVLIVAPTSLMGNWRREANRFTPQLRVLILQGSERQQHFGSMEQYDIVLTTYPLLTRDQECLTETQYHSVILDEAQFIKNPRTKMASVIRQLKSQHRLCLTGTPMENHLGELWALFDFLMPGFLGTQKQFNEIYRKPIEQHGNSERQTGLVKRIQPFLLRRDKNLVAKDLPPKTEIEQRVELGTQQAELYESIRVAMDKKVRAVIAEQGLARSHITILDALLKLRQVCCDPRLLKLPNTVMPKTSSKLTVLMQMLPELLAEERRIIVFSQFTSMLGLIEQELKQQKISYSKLTGKTRKRDEAIDEFCSGKVNVFLISLKAGGVGLNLTTADTVILYDPWWNPAVESQAIDRAYRIGQDKPVFVYKLLVENSIEEKMLAMQQRKKMLAKGIYANKSKQDDAPLFDAASLADLFAPLQP